MKLVLESLLQPNHIELMLLSILYPLALALPLPRPLNLMLPTVRPCSSCLRNFAGKAGEQDTREEETSFPGQDVVSDSLALPCLMTCCKVLEWMQGSSPSGDKVFQNTEEIPVHPIHLSICLFILLHIPPQ